jgi:hypothetical protein
MKRGISAPPSPAQARARYGVNVPNTSEAIWNPLYDYQAKTAAAASQQRFFQTPVGQNSKTIKDTNMTLAGNLPEGQSFLCTGLQVEYFPDIAVNGTDASDYIDDVLEFYKSGALRFTIGSKAWVEQGNLMKFAPVNRMGTDSSTTVGTDRYAIAFATGREFAVAGLKIPSSQNFNVELLELPATSTTGVIGVTLNGYLYRTAQ